MRLRAMSRCVRLDLVYGSDFDAPWGDSAAGPSAWFWSPRRPGRTDDGYDLVDHVAAARSAAIGAGAAEHFELVLQPLGHNFFAKTKETDQDLAQRQGLGRVDQDREVEARVSRSLVCSTSSCMSRCTSRPLALHLDIDAVGIGQFFGSSAV